MDNSVPLGVPHDSTLPGQGSAARPGPVEEAGAYSVMLSLAHWAVTDVLGDYGPRAVFFTGHEGARRRTQNLVDLHDDPATRVLLATDAGRIVIESPAEAATGLAALFEGMAQLLRAQAA